MVPTITVSGGSRKLSIENVSTSGIAVNVRGDYKIDIGIATHVQTGVTTETPKDQLLANLKQLSPHMLQSALGPAKNTVFDASLPSELPGLERLS